jgi:primosomal replication protein N
MGTQEKAEAERELALLAKALAGVMRSHHASAAMVRTYVDPSGQAQVAVNLYTKSANATVDASRQVEFRVPASALGEKVGA